MLFWKCSESFWTQTNICSLGSQKQTEDLEMGILWTGFDTEIIGTGNLWIVAECECRTSIRTKMQKCYTSKSLLLWLKGLVKKIVMAVMPGATIVLLCTAESSSGKNFPLLSSTAFYSFLTLLCSCVWHCSINFPCPHINRRWWWWSAGRPGSGRLRLTNFFDLKKLFIEMKHAITDLTYRFPCQVYFSSWFSFKNFWNIF